MAWFLNKIASILRNSNNVLSIKKGNLQWKEIVLELLNCLVNVKITSKKEKYF